MTMINISVLLHGEYQVYHVMQKQNKNTRKKKEEILNYKL